MMFVKICGTTNLADARLAVEAGADALGFIFAPSKRHVTVEQAAAITAELPRHMGRVGVFTEPDAEAIARAVRDAELTAVQMHWTYNRAHVTAIREAIGEAIELWQWVGFEADAPETQAADEASAKSLLEVLQDDRLAVVLFDSVQGGASGGLGVALPWSRSEQVLKRVFAGLTPPRAPRLVVAGGLHADNVQKAIQILLPWGVDVVSGVEASPGRKSPDRLRAFMKAARP